MLCALRGLHVHARINGGLACRGYFCVLGRTLVLQRNRVGVFRLPRGQLLSGRTIDPCFRVLVPTGFDKASGARVLALCGWRSVDQTLSSRER